MAFVSYLNHLNHYLMSKVITLIALAALLSSTAWAQVFVQTNELEFGISPCGTFHVNDFPPAGYHPNPALFPIPGFGMVSDAARDGWEVGTPPYCGDHILPGAPVEAFSIQVGENWASNITNINNCDFAEFSGNSLETAEFGDLRLALWTGGGKGLSIRQAMLSANGQPALISRVKLCNKTSERMDNVFYQRMLDPDPEQAWSGNFLTNNRILESISTGSGVEGIGPTLPQCRIALLSADDRAQASYGGFNPDKPSSAYFGEGFYSTTGSQLADISVQLSYNLGSLEAGECACVSFAYAFRPGDYAKALNITERACAAFDAFEDDGDGEALAERLYGSNAIEEQRELNWLATNTGFELRDLNSGERVLVYDLHGRLVHSGSSASNQYTVSDLPTAIYLVQVITREGQTLQGKVAVR